MPNGDLLTKLDQFVQEDKLETGVAFRLILLSVKEILEGQKKAEEDRTEIRNKLETETKQIKESAAYKLSAWAEKYPRYAMAVLFVLFTFFIMPHIAETIGYIQLIIEKWLELPAGLFG